MIKNNNGTMKISHACLPFYIPSVMVPLSKETTSQAMKIQ